ncbi:hypothetical protein KY284_010884 [Solanum tuberosum]|nr:hypothetical protein KY284_010884 [Solanum tuberosum]
MDPKKVQAIVDWHAARSVKDLRSFLGLANYYRKFIAGYFKGAVALTDLLKKDVKWVWSVRCQEAFQNLKEAIASEPILKLPDFELPFEVHIDASNKAIGVVLVQEGHPVAFEIQKLNDAEQRLCAANDSLYVRWMGQVQDGTMRRYWIEDDLLHFKGGRIVVPNGGGLRKDLMKEVHDTTWASHPEVERMLALLSRVYFWPKMEDDIKAYVKTCHVCQVDKTGRKKKVGLLQPLLITERPWLSPMTPLVVAKTKNQGKCPAAYRVARDRLEMFSEAQDSLRKAQRRMKKYADQHRRSVEFKVGDKVLLKLTPQIWKQIVSKTRHRDADDPDRSRSKRAPPSIPTQFDAEIEKIIDHRVVGTTKKNTKT